MPYAYAELRRRCPFRLAGIAPEVQASGFQLIFARVVPKDLRRMEQILRRRQLHRAADRLATMLSDG
jgi:hypothetical protein